MIRGAIGHLDVAQLTIWAFWFFFAGLIFYLRREDRREGYPLLNEGPGHVTEDPIFLFITRPKTFILPNGKEVERPDYLADERPLNAQKVEVWPGAPFEPTGDPLLAGVGPGSYAERPDVADKAFDGTDLIQPLRKATAFTVPTEGTNPLGFDLVGVDGDKAGEISDLWVDRAESMVRFFEAKLTSGGAILIPTYFVDVYADERQVKVDAVLGAQFVKAPRLKTPDTITMLEEEKIAAFYGAGSLYATPERAEPWL